MKTAAQILRSKPDQTVHTMEPTASAYEAARFMADKNIGGGCLSAGKSSASSRSATARASSWPWHALRRTRWLSDIMSSPVMYVHPDRTGEECMALMTENRLRHLPVMDGE